MNAEISYGYLLSITGLTHKKVSELLEEGYYSVDTTEIRDTIIDNLYKDKTMSRQIIEILGQEILLESFKVNYQDKNFNFEKLKENKYVDDFFSDVNKETFYDLDEDTKTEKLTKNLILKLKEKDISENKIRKTLRLSRRDLRKFLSSFENDR